MKKSIFIIALVFVSLLNNCTTKTEGTSNKHPDFKIGKAAFEKNLKKEFHFESISYGTYFTKKNGLMNEKGLNLTFQKSDLDSVPAKKMLEYANIIEKKVKEYVLHLEDYNYVNITFEQAKKEGLLEKSQSIKIRKQL